MHCNQSYFSVHTPQLILRCDPLELTGRKLLDSFMYNGKTLDGLLGLSSLINMTFRSCTTSGQLQRSCRARYL